MGWGGNFRGSSGVGDLFEKTLTLLVGVVVYYK